MAKKVSKVKPFVKKSDDELRAIDRVTDERILEIVIGQLPSARGWKRLQALLKRDYKYHRHHAGGMLDLLFIRSRARLGDCLYKYPHQRRIATP